jgi:hypothetical protein
MSGTAGSLSVAAGGINIPQPRVRIYKGSDLPNDFGQHDRVVAGGLTDPEFDAIKDMQPAIWLFRYKRGYNATRASLVPGFNYDNTRGWVHPSDNSGIPTNGRKVGGGGHAARNGAVLPARMTEWSLTAAHEYSKSFDPELWFQDIFTNQYTYPIMDIATATPNGASIIGMSGQSGNNTGANPNADSIGFCDSSRTRGVQVQRFAFAVAVVSPDDPREYLIGPMSPHVKCEIWPRLKVAHSGFGVQYSRGRKIRALLD